ncbi:TadE/TadG family type IV pilus assembly protein [Natranaerobius thermophilus]|uniref:TadE family protein n=1 Tax=Natranaerobius thermophilus (strain ATCC BAA-1301 / DSM 18059 / JW/NM-WN-LF) TaxID=457570 RepID=B2A8K1_NATTJ|nr:TadE family protein [Natranaerobius thermophilus]ACB85885.1 TadE family protein [Natranaerobius thermophilus JW/NM-WN-LF]
MLDQMNRILHRERGQALVELAFVLPVLLLLVFGIIEFGSIFHAQLTLNNASREGARHGVLIAANNEEFEDEVREVIIDRSSSLNNENLVINLTPDSEADEIRRGDDMEVKLEYQKKLLTPIISTIISNSDGHISLSSRTVMRIE